MNVRELSTPIANAEALAGTLEDLLYVADHDLARISRGIVIMTWAPHSEPISEADREDLWHRFGVPVFVQYFDADNELLATECDAHSGLHLVDSVASARGYLPASGPCPCGDTRPLLVLASEADSEDLATGATA